MPKINLTALAVAAVLLPLGLAGCGDGASSAPQRTDELVIVVQGDAKQLDPHQVTDAASMRMIENMYSTLLRYSPDGVGDPQPDLAESVEVSDDGLTVTVKLVAGATFHSRRAVTAADVKYSIERIVRKDIRARQFETVKSINTPDERTVVLQLTEPTAALKTYLAYPMNAIVDREVVEANDDELRNVDAGSGPYQLADWQQDRFLKLTAHDGYHIEGLPRTPKLTYRPIADETARTTALRTGEADILHEVPAKDVDLLKRADNVEVRSVPGTFWEYIGINTAKPPLIDPRVRRAIAWAVDRRQLNQAVKFGLATLLTGGHIPPGHWAHADFEAYPSRDVAKAKQLLADAGYTNGIEIEMVVDATVDYQVRAAEMVKQQLADAGITVDLRSAEPGVFYNDLNDRNFETTLVGWLGFVDPDEWVADIYHSDGKYNQQGYRNADVDQMIETAARTLDREQRAALYAKIQQQIAEDAPTVFLYINPHVTAMRSGVEGYDVHPTGTTIFARGATLSGAAAE